ncbi:MAG: S8 family serine peptidase [Pseudomonadota bacterium]
MVTERSTTEKSAPERTTRESNLHTVPLRGARRNYMIAPRRGVAAKLAGVQAITATAMNNTLSTLGVEVVRRVRRTSGTVQALSSGPGEATDIAIVRIEPERAEALRQTLPSSLMIAEDKPLVYDGHVTSQQAASGVEKFSNLARITGKRMRFRVLGANDKPLARAQVQLTGDAFPTLSTTDEEGEVELTLTTIGGDQQAKTLSVTPLSDYWDLYVSEPTLSDTATNVVRVRSFRETIPGFPEQFRFGWGQRLMGLDKLPQELGGAGVKIAIIDSGCDNTHPLLSHIKLGRDFTDGTESSTNWNQDLTGHGTHCAGIIAASSKDKKMLRGFAPEAEIHILKVFPGGSYSSLLEALDYCINNEIDVVNLSLGGDTELNVVVEEALQFAVLHGVACVVAAGNSGTTVTYPASSPETLAVAAIGNINEIQPNTSDALTIQSGQVSGDGIFSPSFSCRGPEIAVSAPGVGIVSTVPGAAFDAESGTSMAAAHVTGVAALLLAHHPLFHAQFRTRNSDRAAALFNVIRSLCAPEPLATQRVGAGVPQLGPILAALQAKPSQATQQTVGAGSGVSAISGAVASGIGTTSGQEWWSSGGMHPLARQQQGAGSNIFGATQGGIPIPPQGPVFPRWMLNSPYYW